MIRAIAVLSVAVLAVCLVRCTPPPPPDKRCQPAGGFGGGGGPDDDFRVAGDDVSVVMFLPIECPTELEVKATVSVQDPNNMPLALLEGEATRVVTDRVTGVGMSTTVKVRGAAPGSYHFVARFEPNLGTVQTDVLLAENKRDAGPELIVPGGAALSGCAQLDLTEGGRLLCLGDTVQLFERDGKLVQTLAQSASAARVGQELWVVDATRVTRWVEGDAGFVLAPDAGVDHGLQSPIFAADSTELMLVGQTAELRFVHAAAGRLVVEVFSAATTSNPLGLWKSKESFAMIGQDVFSNEQVTACGGSLRDGGSSCRPLFKGNGATLPIASEPGVGLWATSDNPFVFPPTKTLSLISGGATRDFGLPASWDGVLAGQRVRWDSAPRLISGSRRLFVLDRAGAFVLQAFPDQQLISATSRWISMSGPNGSVLIYRR